MRIGIGIIAYNVATELDGLIKSLASNTSEHSIIVYLHQHSTREKEPDVTFVCECWQGMTRPPFEVKYKYHGINRGIAASWNDALYQGYEVDGCDVVLLVNDDITFLPGALDTFAEFAVAHRENYMVTTLGYHNHYATNTQLGEQPLWGFGFSCFAVNPIALQTIGYFDENFFPIYYEDCDYGRRGYLAGLQMAECKNAGIVHWGSLSAKQDGQAEVLQSKSPLNAAYYHKKWGGGPGEEKFPYPFNVAADVQYNSRTRREPLYDRYDRPRIINGKAWPSTEPVYDTPTSDKGSYEEVPPLDIDGNNLTALCSQTTDTILAIYEQVNGKRHTYQSLLLPAACGFRESSPEAHQRYGDSLYNAVRTAYRVKGFGNARRVYPATDR